MDPKTLRYYGVYCFGKGWQRRLADTLGVNRRTIACWMLGIGQPDADAAAFIEALARHEAKRRELIVTYHVNRNTAQGLRGVSLANRQWQETLSGGRA